jgi:hypothetical protein
MSRSVLKDDRHMNLFCDSTRPFARLQPASRARLLLLSFAVPALCVVICLGLFSSSVQATFTPNSSRDHVYLFRGLVPVLSSGMGEIAARLRKQGINATVYNQSEWPQLTEKITAGYKKGRLRKIILVGYSAGAGAMINTTVRLAERGIPVKLAISLDPVWPITAVGRVDRYVNYYNSYGSHSVRRGKQFKGSVQNVDVRGTPGVGHLNIDNDVTVQGRVIKEIRAALQTDHHATSSRNVVTSAGRQADKAPLPGS